MIDHGFDMEDLPAFLSTVDDMVDELETLQRQYDELESRFETVQDERNSLQDEVYHLHGGE
jgi:FtsZ-binding cell division protein ZapB